MALGLPSVLVGSWTDEVAETGVTVVLPPAGTLGAIAVRGGAPGNGERSLGGRSPMSHKSTLVKLLCKVDSPFATKVA